MNGFEFANKALSIKGYALDSIIKLTDGAEVDWLEFKAAIKDQNAKETGKANEYDFIFHLLKALVSMANGSGGMVLLGVDDEGNAVGLKHSGYDGDKDKFTRYISDKVFIRESWRTQLSGEWRWENNADQIYFDPQWARLQGADVLVFTVPPREKSLGPLFLINTTHKNPEPVEYAFVRAGGDRGKVLRLSREDAKNWWVQRDVSLYSRKFTTWINELQKTDPALFHSAVTEFCRGLVHDTEDIECLYVPLEAEARILRDRSVHKKRIASDDYLKNNKNVDQPTKWRGEFESIVEKLYPAFLIGEPGAGKSTSLLKLARELNKGFSASSNAWALYVPLSGYTESGLRNLIRREIPPLNWSDIELGLDSGSLTLLLDGLNECPSMHYEQCANDLSDLLKEHPESKVFISTRISHLPLFAGNTIELRSMGTARQQQFLQNYLGGDLGAVRSFWSELSLKITAQLIARSPILLRMAVWVWKDLGNIPGGLAELYSTFFDAWIRRELEKDLNAGSVNVWTEDQTREALALLAYSMRFDGLVACSQSYATDKLRLSLGDKSGDFIARIAQGLLIERARNGQTIRFKHESIQEFLVAVFLTSHAKHQLIQTSNKLDNRRWSMPIVFAFELFEQPPEHFIQTAWQIAPLLVCAAFRDGDRLKLLPEPINRHYAPQNDLWVRGIIRCMSGGDVSEITRRLAYLGRTPSPGRYFQKHPLPEELTNSLEGGAFWYALKTHENGHYRIERLQHLLIDRRNLWLELLPHVIVGQPEWLIHLTNSQKLLVGELEEKDRDIALSEASIVELCYMMRNQIILEEEFRTHWKRALNVDNTEPLELEILALLASKKIKASQFNGTQRSALKSIGSNTELSPRILSVLVRDSILKAADVRRDLNNIKRLVSRVSPIRAKQLVQTGVLRREDFNDHQLLSLYDKISTDKDISFILDAGLADNRQQIPKQIRDRVHGYGKPKSIESQFTSRPAIPNISGGTDATSDNLISQVFLTQEQMRIKEIRREVEDPKNYPPENGYHHMLAKHVEDSKEWPQSERETLIDLAEAFFRKHASKKRQKEYCNIIRSAREKILIDEAH